VQTLVGTEPADEAPASKDRVYVAGARPAPRPPRFTPERMAAASTALVVIASTVFVIWQLHPMTLLFTNTMDAGGDNAGHIAAPYYLIHQLLTHGQISGWDPQWFDGYPLYVFYFPLPALLVAILNLVMPYAVAFKLATVAGTVVMPGAAYLFGRLARFRRPVPALMAAAMLPFLWNTSYTIDGGNIASTMAGEFSFTLSMAFGLVFLGVVARGLETGRGRGLAAVLFACTLLCHVVPGLFFAFGALVFTVARFDVQRLKFLIPAGVTGGLLAGFWLIPFGTSLSYSSSMGYSRVTTFRSDLLPVGYWWVLCLAVLGCLFALRLLERNAIALAVLIGSAAAAFVFLPSGQVYNERWLPFYFMAASLMAAYGIGELVRTAGTLLEFERWHETVGALLGGAAAVVVVGIPVGALQFVGIGNPNQMSFVPGWISWNYTGFQAKPGWNVFEGIVQLLDVEGAKYGCGRMEYEYTGPQLTDQFGSTMAFMSLPMWTNGCIDTTEGLYFESSTTTPFHFLDQSEISATPSDPVVGIPYQSYNVVDGIRHDQLMGVRYLLAGSTSTEAAADKDPSLQFVGSTPGVPTQNQIGNKVETVQTTWKLYLIKDSPLVTALSYEPVVENMSAANWLNLGITWYQNESDWDVPLALGGPPSWPHLSAGTLESPKQAIPVKPTTVSDVVMNDESISFNVSTLGTPVVVKVPYFPNWKASGAEGPWEATPNLMVVVPTSHHVTLTYGTSTADWAGYAASGLGLGLVVTYAVLPPVGYEPRRRRRAQGVDDDFDDDLYTGPATGELPVVDPGPGGTDGPPDDAFVGPATTMMPAVDAAPPDGFSPGPGAPGGLPGEAFVGPATTMMPAVVPLGSAEPAQLFQVETATPYPAHLPEPETIEPVDAVAPVPLPQVETLQPIEMPPVAQFEPPPATPPVAWPPPVTAPVNAPPPDIRSAAAPPVIPPPPEPAPPSPTAEDPS
jgi:hypothetical protein